MAKLIYPKPSSNISQVTAMEPMKLMIDGKPATGMKVVNYLLVIDKDGVMTSLQIAGTRSNIEFIDYLGEDESITIFGSGTGKPEDDPRESPIDESTVIPFSLEIGGSDYLDQPLYMPFYVTRKGSKVRRIAMLARYKSTQGHDHSNGQTIIVDETGYDFADPRRSSGADYISNNYAFDGMADEKARKILRARNTNGHGSPADYDDWPA